MSETQVSKVSSNVFDGQNCEKYVEDGKNKYILKCPRCGSKILEKQSARYIEIEKSLPQPYVSKDKSIDTSEEAVKEFFHVENMYTFENIGFTHAVNNLKYLTCADCETGPLGYFEIGNSHSYLALSRVTHH